jgi:hypothetical protein
LSPRIIDSAIVFLVSAGVLSLFFMPIGVKNPLRLFSVNATAVTIFGNNYIHFDFWNHLVPNVIAFLGVGLIMSFLLGTIGMRGLFYKVLIFNLFVTPWLASASWLLFGAKSFSPLTPAFGFSGVVAAFAGALGVSFLLLTGGVMKFRFSYGVVAAIVFVPFVFALTYTFIIGLLALEYALVAGAAFSAYFYLLYRTIDPEVKLRGGTKPSAMRKLYALSLPYLILLIFSVVMFPLQIATKSGEVNIFVHYVGLAIGIISTSLLSVRGIASGRPTVPVAPPFQD